MEHYTEDQRRAQGKKLNRARNTAAQEFQTARRMALAGIADGVPEAQLAEQLGVDRMTIRKWAGKR